MLCNQIRKLPHLHCGRHGRNVPVYHLPNSKRRQRINAVLARDVITTLRICSPSSSIASRNPQPLRFAYNNFALSFRDIEEISAGGACLLGRRKRWCRLWGFSPSFSGVTSPTIPASQFRKAVSCAFSMGTSIAGIFSYLAGHSADLHLYLPLRWRRSRVES